MHRRMKRHVTIILIFIFTLCSTLHLQAAQQRKTVAVVLSGGGAKGVAHARALKVIEEAGIPVDIVVGTSMGSIVGALYAVGYNAEQLDSIIAAQSWTNLLIDATDRRKISFTDRQQTEKYIVSAHFEKSPFEVMKGGLLKGNSIAMLMSELTADYQQPIDYNKLPIRYACVATDILTNTEIDIHEGILAESMRTSMAIPGVFAPIKKDGRVLVDGGLCNNFPTDVAKQMGADIIIGVDVSDESNKTPADINTPMDVLSKLMDNLCSNKKAENVALTDVYIRVNVNGYSAASFTKPAIDTLLVRGETAARDKWNELVALRSKIGLSGPVKNIDRPRKHLSYTGSVVPPATIYNADRRASYVGLGARFDNEELASLLVGGMYEFRHSNQLRASVDVRLGKRFQTTLNGSVNMFEKWSAKAQYKLNMNKLEIHNKGAAAADVSYTENFARLSMSRSWRMMKLTFGAEYSHKHFTKINTNSDLDFLQTEMRHESNVSYNAQLQYDNMDDAQYPHAGRQWSLRYNYYTDNGYNFGGKAGQHIVDGFFRIAIPVYKSTTLLPYIAARSISERNTHFSNTNLIGGTDHDGFYVPQQLSFAGVNYIQGVENSIAIVGVNLRQRLTTNNYVFGIFNMLTEGNTMKKIFDQQEYGCALGYGYRTPAGPVEANLNWSSITRSVGLYLSFGYKF